MSVIACDEMGNRRTASLDSKGARKYTRIFKVITDDPCTTAGDVGNADCTGSGGDAIPLLFTTFVVPNKVDRSTSFSDVGARVVEIRPREDGENPYVWEVEVNYDSNCGDEDLGLENPLLRAPVIEWDWEEIEAPLTQDLDGNSILNSAYCPFNPPPTYPTAFPMLKIERNEPVWDDATWEANADFAYTVNLDTFYGFYPGQARMKPIKAVPQTENNQDFYRVTYIIQFRTPINGDVGTAWHFKPLDQGVLQLNTDGTKIVPIRDDTSGAYVTSPKLLNGLGRVLDPTISSPVFLDFEIYEGAFFGALNLE